MACCPQEVHWIAAWGETSAADRVSKREAVSEWVGGWVVDESVSEWVGGGWISEWVGEWVDEWVSDWSEGKGKRVSEQTVSSVCKSDFFLDHLSCFLSFKYYLYLTTAENKRVLKVKMLCLKYVQYNIVLYLRFFLWLKVCQQVYCRRVTISSLSLTPLLPVTHCPCVKLAVPVGKFFFWKVIRVEQEEQAWVGPLYVTVDLH